MMHTIYISIIVILLFIIEHLIRENKKHQFFNSKGLNDKALEYYLYLNSELTENNKHLLSKAKEVLFESQKEYSPSSNVPHLVAMYGNDFKDTFRKEVFSYCMILRFRNYPDNDIARKATYVYYEEYEKAFADLYDCSILQGIKFPMSIVNYYYPKGYEIIEKQSKYFNNPQVY